MYGRLNNLNQVIVIPDIFVTIYVVTMVYK